MDAKKSNNKLMRGLIFLSPIIILWSYLYLNPQVCFNIPVIGFIPWMMVGGHMPPFKDEFSLQRCSNPESCPWLESGDVIVNACAKCGTNWMMTVVHELRTFDKPELQDFEDILDVSPWLDLFQNPYDFRENRSLTWGEHWNNPELPFKQYKGHIYPHKSTHFGTMKQQLVPIRERPDVKYLVMVRHPEDMVASLINFLTTHEESWYELWGLPQPIINTDLFIFCLNWFAKPASPFNFFAHWWEYRNDPNVLLIHYSNVFKNTDKYMKLIADFVGIEASEEVLQHVKSKTSVSYMKARNEKYRHRVGYNKTITVIKSAKELNGRGLISKGGTGRGSEALSEHQKLKLKQHGLKFLEPQLVDLLYSGFEHEDLKHL